MGSNRQTLKDATAEAHIRLEDCVGEISSRAAYVGYLRGMHAFRVSIERSLADISWPGFFESWRPAYLGTLIAADLNDLGEQPLPVPRLAPPPSIGAILGTLYVTEGASLGARLIFKNAQRLGFSDSFGARHLAQQAASMSDWKEFTRLIEMCDPTELPEAIAAANATFEGARLAMLEAAATKPHDRSRVA